MPNKSLDLFRNRWAQPFRDFDQMVEELFQLRKNGVDLSPSFELTEDTAAYMARFDLPGIKKEDVKIDLTGQNLTVYAERTEEKKTEDKRTHYSEISYGSYTRSIALPTAIDDAKIEAKFDNGVLTIRLPKTKLEPTKKIAVQ